MKCKMKLNRFSCSLYDSNSYPDDYQKHLFVLQDVENDYVIRCLRNCCYEYRMDKIGYFYFDD